MAPPRPPAPGRPCALRGVSQAMRPSRCPLSWPHHEPPGAAQGWRGATPLPQLPWSGPSPTCPAAPTCAAPSGGGPAPSAVGPGPPRAPLRFQPERAVGSDAAPGTSRPAMHVPEPSSSRDCYCCQLPGSGGRAGMALRLPCPPLPHSPLLPALRPPPPLSSAAPSTALVLGDSPSSVPGPYCLCSEVLLWGAPGRRPLWGALAGPYGCHWSAPEGRGCRPLPAPALTSLLALCGRGRTWGGGRSSTGPAHPWGTLLFQTLVEVTGAAGLGAHQRPAPLARQASPAPRRVSKAVDVERFPHGLATAPRRSSANSQWTGRSCRPLAQRPGGSREGSPTRAQREPAPSRLGGSCFPGPLGGFWKVQGAGVSVLLTAVAAASPLTVGDASLGVVLRARATFACHRGLAAFVGGACSCGRLGELPPSRFRRELGPGAGREQAVGTATSGHFAGGDRAPGQAPVWG